MLAMLGDHLLGDHLRTEGSLLLEVYVGFSPAQVERHRAVWVRFACGGRDERGDVHGGCGAQWGAPKLEGDPDPPADPQGRHARCAETHALVCARCKAFFKQWGAWGPSREEVAGRLLDGRTWDELPVGTKPKGEPKC